MRFQSRQVRLCATVAALLGLLAAGVGNGQTAPNPANVQMAGAGIQKRCRAEGHFGQQRYELR